MKLGAFAGAVLASLAVGELVQPGSPPKNLLIELATNSSLRLCEVEVFDSFGEKISIDVVNTNVPALSDNDLAKCAEIKSVNGKATWTVALWSGVLSSLRIFPDHLSAIEDVKGAKVIYDGKIIRVIESNLVPTFIMLEKFKSSSCPPGTREDRSGECEMCAPNQYSQFGGKCVNCPSGSVPNAVRTSCLPCGSGTIAPSGSETCEKCPAGQYANPNRDRCWLCSNGFFSSEGSDVCSACKENEWSPKGASQCQTCAAGTVPRLDKSACWNCPAGFAAIAGAVSCSSCVGGTWSGGKQEKCLACQAGTFPNDKHSGCSNCRPGSFSREGFESCLSCEGRTVTTKYGSSECERCVEPLVPNKYHSGCVSCPTGYVPDGETGGCVSCKENEIASKEGKCITCEAGSYAFRSSQCNKCRAGDFAPPASAQCFNCPAGTFSTAGSAECQLCGPGTTSSVGKDRCSGCRGGYCPPTFLNAGGYFVESLKKLIVTTGNGEFCLAEDPDTVALFRVPKQNNIDAIPPSMVSEGACVEPATVDTILDIDSRKYWIFADGLACKFRTEDYDFYANKIVYSAPRLPDGVTLVSACPYLERLSSNYLGCWKDDNVRVLEFDSRGEGNTQPIMDNTVQKCINSCRSNGFNYAGLEYSWECWCGDSYQRDGRAGEGECLRRCTGNDGQICGDSFRLSVYSTNQSPDLVKTEYRGCYSEYTPHRVFTHRVTLDETRTSVSMCVRECSKAGFPFSGLTNGNQCWCGGNYFATLDGQESDSMCTSICPGNKGEYCGGSKDVFSIYANVGYNQALPVPFSAGSYFIQSIETTVISDGKGKYCFPEDNAALTLLGFPSPKTVEYIPLSMTPSGTCTEPSETGSFLKVNNDVFWVFGTGKVCQLYNNQTAYFKDKAITTVPRLPNSLSLSMVCPFLERLSTNYQGCWKDDNARILKYNTHLADEDKTITTVAKCVDACRSNGYGYAGLQKARECWCGSGDFTRVGRAPEEDCSMPCSGDAGQKCGGDMRVSVYSTSNAPDLVAVNYRGCFQESNPHKAFTRRISLNEARTTVSLCATGCDTAGFGFSALHNGKECWCAKSYMPALNGRENATLCELPCSGDKGEVCGGEEDAFSIFGKGI